MHGVRAAWLKCLRSTPTATATCRRQNGLLIRRRYSRRFGRRGKISEPVERDGDVRYRRLCAWSADYRHDAQEIDTDGDGTISHDEFIAYQSKVFDMMDKNKKGSLGPQEFLGK